MQHTQQLMKVSEMKEPSGEISTMDRVIVPKMNGAANCKIPKCQSCLILSAKQRSTKIVDHKTPTYEGAVSKDGMYQPRESVSMNQYVAKTSGCLPTGYGRELESNSFHGGTIFCDAGSKYLFVKNQVSLGADETIQAKNEFETWL